MARGAAAEAELRRLRRDIAAIEGRLAEDDRLTLDRDSEPAESKGRSLPRRRLPLGMPSLDGLLGGGLPLAALHEIRAGETRDGGVACGFLLALVARLHDLGASSVLWISEADVRRETGGLYAPGLAALGLDPRHVVEVAVRTELEALWAFEAALSCTSLGVAVCELRQASLDLSATRRSALRARESGVTGFLLRLGNAWAEPSAAELRLCVTPALAGTIGNFSVGIGRMAWRLSLEKNRLGPTGNFTVEWKAHERSFSERATAHGEGRVRAHPQPLLSASSDRPPDPPPQVQFRRAS